LLAIEWLRLAASERAQRDATVWLDRLARNIAAGVRSGLRGRADALRATLERDAAIAEAEVTSRDRESIARQLGRELGQGVDFAPAVREEDESLLGSPSPADSLALLDALQASPEIRLARLGAAERQLDLDAARRHSGWRVDVAADAGLAGSDLTRLIPPDVRLADPNATFWDRLHRDLGASIALQFHRPLLDRSVAATVLARDADARAQDIRGRAAQDAQARLLVELLARWRSAATRYALAQEVAVRAEEHLLRLESLHAAGAANLLELLDARRTHDDAAQRLIDARAEALAARLDAEERRP
jgi:outer membrane protein TolC